MRAKKVFEENWKDILPPGISRSSNIEFEDIIDSLDIYLEEFNTFKEFMDDYDLNGKIFMGQNDWEYNEENMDDLIIHDVGYDDFHCGPSTDGAVSDTVRIDDYLESIVVELGIDANIGEAENYHSFNVRTGREAIEQYEKLKNRISKDFTVDES